jgi:hypothetical protein
MTSGAIQCFIDEGIVVLDAEPSHEQSTASVLVRPGRGERWGICFGGLANGVGMPPFEFAGILESIDVNVILVRDLSQTWYHGFAGADGSGLARGTEVLSAVIDTVGAAGGAAIGNSAGGYAALYFAAALGLPTALAFSPQTRLSPTFKATRRDPRWPRQTLSTYRRSGLRSPSYRLRDALGGPDMHSITARVVYPAHHRLDALHAQDLDGLGGVTLDPLPSDSHSMVKDLRDGGQLQNLLAASLGMTS